jgi:hypothetical protein
VWGLNKLNLSENTKIDEKTDNPKRPKPTYFIADVVPRLYPFRLAFGDKQLI